MGTRTYLKKNKQNKRKQNKKYCYMEIYSFGQRIVVNECRTKRAGGGGKRVLLLETQLADRLLL